MKNRGDIMEKQQQTDRFGKRRLLSTFYPSFRLYWGCIFYLLCEETSGEAQGKTHLQNDCPFFFFISSIFSEAYRPSTNSLQVRGLPLFPFLSRTGRQLLICYRVQPPKGNITSYLQNRPPQVPVNKLESITCL